MKYLTNKELKTKTYVTIKVKTSILDDDKFWFKYLSKKIGFC